MTRSGDRPAPSRGWLRGLVGRAPATLEDPQALRHDARRAAGDGEFERARALLERALALEPGSPDARSDLGNVLVLLGDDSAAAASYAAALALAADHGPALANLAQLHARRGDRAAARECFRRAVRADPWSPHALRGLADWLPDDAVPHAEIALLREIVGVYPDHAAAHAALGRAHLRGSFDAAPALAALERALALGHREVETLAAHGTALHELGRFDEALAAFDAARSLDPQHVNARFHRSITLLTLGRFAEAWPDYELRLLSEDRPRRAFPFPRWNGERLAGKTILVHAEQGLGDEILFASCLADVIAAAGHCVIDCSPKLEALFRRSFPAASVHRGEQSDPVDWAHPLGIDVQCPAGSLPLHLRASPAAFPARGAYLRADPVKVGRWRERLAALGPGPAIGLSWRGGTPRTRTERRSLRLADLAPILAAGGAQFVSLQYGPDAAAELDRFAADGGARVHHWQAAIDDYDETAALVAALDGVVSVCTSIVHLGGALGRPVWVATPRVPEWRYGAAGDALPWYASVRLIRQSRPGDWAGVVATIRGEIAGARAADGDRCAG
jgi:Flp pilus assembly protein TadD